jgi:FkbM family methyltransferase
MKWLCGVKMSDYNDRVVDGGSEISDELLSIFKRDDKIIIADIGACDGLSSVIYSKIFPNAFIHAFEMIEENYEEIISNFDKYGITGRAMVYNAALSWRNGKSTMWKSSGAAPGMDDHKTGNTSSSLFRPRKHLDIHSWCKFGCENINVWTLDHFNIGCVDFVHMDVQGAELDVLRGGKMTMSRCKAIWLEVSNCDMYKDQPLKSDVEKYLSAQGYRVMKDACGYHLSGDMLWVR